MSQCFRLSEHAQKRLQQRGIDEAAIAAVIYFGERFHADEGNFAYYMSRRAIERASHSYGMQLSDYQDAAVIATPHMHIITVQFVARPKKSWRGKH
jgi:hypothetical protein